MKIIINGIKETERTNEFKAIVGWGFSIKKAWNKIKRGAKRLAKKVKRIWNRARKFVKRAWNKVRNFWNRAKDFFRKKYYELKNKYKTLQDRFKSAVNRLKSKIKRIYEKYKRYIKRITERYKRIIKDLRSKIKNIKNIIKEKVNKIIKSLLNKYPLLKKLFIYYERIKDYWWEIKQVIKMAEQIQHKDFNLMFIARLFLILSYIFPALKPLRTVSILILKWKIKDIYTFKKVLKDTIKLAREYLKLKAKNIEKELREKIKRKLQKELIDNTKKLAIYNYKNYILKRTPQLTYHERERLQDIIKRAKIKKIPTQLQQIEKIKVPGELVL